MKVCQTRVFVQPSDCYGSKHETWHGVSGCTHISAFKNVSCHKPNFTINRFGGGQLSIFRFAPKPPRLTIVDRNQTYLKGRQVQSDTTPLLLDAHVELSHHFLFQLYHYTVSEHLVTTSKLIGDAHVRMNK